MRRTGNGLTNRCARVAWTRVRGPGRDIQFGGLSDKGAWKRYEIEWLRSLAVPLYLARLDESRSRVDLFSFWPIWLVLAVSRAPFRIICECEDRSDKPQDVRPRSSELTDSGHGDGLTWTVPLGPPFLSFRQNDLDDSIFAHKGRELLLQWIGLDRATLLRFQLGVSYVEGIRTWSTNEFDSAARITKQFMSWSSIKGENIDRITRTIEPLLVNLGVHLQWQDDPNVYRLIPLLELLESVETLSTMGAGLLNGIRETQQQGVSPKPR